jgi:hypothetical protein
MAATSEKNLTGYGNVWKKNINLPLSVRPDVDTWFVRLSPPTVLELQL